MKKQWLPLNRSVLVKAKRFFGLCRGPGVVMAVAVVAAAGVASPADAQANDRVLSFDLGVGPGYAPEYEGSSEYSVVPAFAFKLNQLRVGSINIERPRDRLGFSFGPSFRYLSKRDSSDFPILAGIPDNDEAFELGLRASYDWEYFNVFAKLRKGVTGHHGYIGELGSDIKYGISDRTFITVGPRAAFGDSEYMSYAFDVPATATMLAPYNAGGGLKSVGVEAQIRHQMNDKWALQSRFAWEHYVDDAADSPIVRSGDVDQFKIGIMLVRTFQLRF